MGRPYFQKLLLAQKVHYDLGVRVRGCNKVKLWGHGASSSSMGEKRRGYGDLMLPCQKKNRYQELPDTDKPSGQDQEAEGALIALQEDGVTSVAPKPAFHHVQKGPAPCVETKNGVLWL